MGQVLSYRPSQEKGAHFTDGPFGRRRYTQIYAIEAPSVGRVKIGRTLQIETRFSSMQGNAPVPLLLRGYVWLPFEAEPALHSLLMDFNCHREWFLMSPPVVAIVDLIAEKKARELYALIPENYAENSYGTINSHIT